MTFLSEDPWGIVGGLGLLAVGFLVALKLTGQGKYLVRASVCLGIAGVVLLVEWLWVTDNERIERVVYELRDAVAASNVEAVLEHLTKDVQFMQGEAAISGEGTRELIRSQLGRARFDFVRVSNLETKHGVQTRRGTALFQVFAKGSLDTSVATMNVGTANSSWSLGFEETSPGVWKVNRISALSGLRGLGLSPAGFGRFPRGGGGFGR